MRHLYRSSFTLSVLLLLLLLLLLGGLFSLQAGATAVQDTLQAKKGITNPYYDMLYGRALSKVQQTPEDVSQTFHLLWMAYQVDSTRPSVLDALSNVFTLTKQYPKAYEFLDKAYYYSGKDKYIGMNLLSLAMGLQKWDKALALCQELQKKSPEDPRLLQRQLEIFSQTGKYQETEALKRAIEQPSLQGLQLLFKKAEILLQEGKRAEALAVVKEQLAKRTPDRASLIASISFYTKYVAGDEAREKIVQLRTLYPHEPDSYVLEASLEATLHNYTAVGKAILQLAQQEGVTPDDIQEVIAHTYEVSGKDSTLMQALIPTQQQLVELYPRTGAFRAQLANNLISANRASEAEPLLQELMAQDSTMVLPYYYFADKYGREEKVDSLLNLSQRGVKLFPKDATLWIYLLSSYAQKGQNEQALKLVPQAEQQADSHSRLYPRLLMIIGDLFVEAQQPTKAFDFYRRSIALAPDPLAYNNYAYALAVHGKPTDLHYAEELASKAVKASASEASFLDTYAWILYLKGEYALAKVYQENALENAKDDSAVYYEHYGDILLKLGEKNKALEAYDKASPASGQEQQPQLQQKIQRLRKELEER